MIFTIGHTENYLEAMLADPELKKIGRREKQPNFPDGYLGGTVWKTRKEARAYIEEELQRDHPDWDPADFSVFGVDADWERDTYIPEDDMPSLLRDAKLINLED